ncbi:two component transcriptional regulator [Sulfuricella denitrificans skB26]|uniref:Two component transcriptional regulator n=1 Tax=Sulfuricella denitrificans (strain DSM 22764 / NBRC 105220 / skB26) TaxID=1163617 RepID=S6B7G8_SULDS|nr:response regulator transcription factor [Sulfuricella denitrificans]BAN36387.1 two component transcriptional regulator [Sulfuricella denitrificans skB26]
MNILLIEDNRDLALNMFDYFEAKGHDMDLAGDGITGLHLAASNQYDVLILDLMLPGIDGLTLCRRLREAGKHTPVLMLTARDSLDDKIAGLEAGADDYVVKPFALREVEARLRALVRRAQVREGSSLLQVGDLSFNPDTLKVMRGERTIELPPIPLKILELLMRQSPRVLSREELERGIWGDSPPDSDALRAHLHILRNAIDKQADKSLIRTLRGIGYQISDD